MSSRRGPVFAERKRVHWGRWVLAALLLLIAVFGVYVAMDNGRVTVKTQKVLVWDLPADLEGFTILHISDLNAHRFGPAQKQIASALSSKKYNAVCITGDMVGKSGDPYPFYELLAVLDPNKPVYYVAGDADPAPLGTSSNSLSLFADWVQGAETRKAIYLDAPASLQVGKSTVWFSDALQLSLDLKTAAEAYASSSTGMSAYQAGIIEETRQARYYMEEDHLHVVLSHKPVTAERVQQLQGVTDDEGNSFVRSVDLLLAGGTAGGQWRLPIVGPVWSDGQWFPPDEETHGYHYAGGIVQYISAGLGTDGNSPLPNFRMLNTPEMTLITFTSEIDEGVLP